MSWLNSPSSADRLQSGWQGTTEHKSLALFQRDRVKIYSDSRQRQPVGLVWMWRWLGLGAERPAPFGLEILADDACGRHH